MAGDKALPVAGAKVERRVGTAFIRTQSACIQNYCCDLIDTLAF
jgi:hypothetical protein